MSQLEHERRQRYAGEIPFACAGIANKFDGSKFRESRGRPRVDEETERLVVRMGKENPGRGYDRIVGAMANLGLRLSDQTGGNILRRHDIPPAPKRKQARSWKDFILAHMAGLGGTYS